MIIIKKIKNRLPGNKESGINYYFFTRDLIVIWASSLNYPLRDEANKRKIIK